MNILIIGDGNHVLIKNWVKNIKASSNFTIDIFSIHEINKISKTGYNNIFYARSFNSLYDHKFLRKFVYLFEIISRFKRIHSHYDIIHIHLAKTQYNFILPFIKLKSKKLIVSIWGSEFYRASKWKKLLLSPIYSMADSIHCTNENLKISLVKENKIPEGKITVIPMFLEILKKLEPLLSDNMNFKDELGWNKNKVQITLGYNYNSGQQHKEIIGILNSSFLSDYSEKIEFVLPLTYGNSMTYREEILNIASILPCKTFTFTTFLSESDVAKIRIANEIFLNLQITDQYSGSFVESLYAGNIVITGSWLPYQNLKNAGVFFIEINKIDDLPNCLKNILNDFEFFKEKSKKNTEILKKMFDSKYILKQWLDYYSGS